VRPPGPKGTRLRLRSRLKPAGIRRSGGAGKDDRILPCDVGRRAGSRALTMIPGSYSPSHGRQYQSQAQASLALLDGFGSPAGLRTRYKSPLLNLLLEGERVGDFTIECVRPAIDDLEVSRVAGVSRAGSGIDLDCLLDDPRAVRVLPRQSVHGSQRLFRKGDGCLDTYATKILHHLKAARRLNVAATALRRPGWGRGAAGRRRGSGPKR
jgi:hypothetical protein